jgi:predicted Ser/Thr protein kinase
VNELGLDRATALAGRESPPKWRAFRPTVWTTEVHGRSVIVKDYSGANWLYRSTLGRIELAREHRAYQRLAGLPFLPHCYGKLDRHALLFEHLDAEPLQNAPPAMVPQALEQLRGAVEAMHERGILHNDLRHRRNILIDKAGNVRVIDFAGALYVTRGWRSLLFGWLAGVDRSAAIKWQLRYCPERISRPDLEWYRGFLRRRSFWPQWNPRSKRQQETLRRLERESPSPPR